MPRPPFDEISFKDDAVKPPERGDDPYDHDVVHDSPRAILDMAAYATGLSHETCQDLFDHGYEFVIEIDQPYIWRQKGPRNV